MTNYKEIVELADTHGDEAVILLTDCTQRDILRARLIDSIDAMSDRIKNPDASEWIVPDCSGRTVILQKLRARKNLGCFEL